ncbi:MAG: gliding motility protein GldC [Flavobacteriales bacterium]|nr:gliding motility protein GldC [Flavobacteriales bacterium]
MKESEIKFAVSLDENNVPEVMEWSSSDNKEGGICNAALISIWDKKENNTLKIDLWTKDMSMDDMRMMFHQTLFTLADTYQRATGEDKMSFHMKEFARFFGEETGILEKPKDA